ncbi:MAG: hypothetical protein R3E50_12525 [Halioglobus sp.]
MTRLLLACILSLSAAGAFAVDWPWQDAPLAKPPEYCKGLVVGGLLSKQVSGMSRTDLWLAWSYVIRSGALGHKDAVDDYRAGLQQFESAPDAAAAQSILQQADGECGLGRTGLQITGW